MNNIPMQKQIKELENQAQNLLTEAMAISPDRMGHEQQNAIRAMQSGLRGWILIGLGELKNAFNMGIPGYLVTEEDDKLKQEIDTLSKSEQITNEANKIQETE